MSEFDDDRGNGEKFYCAGGLSIRCIEYIKGKRSNDSLT